MGREEKRKMDRLEQWFNSLAEDKKQMIYGIINDKINSNNNMMNVISDMCMIGALDDVLEVTIHDIKNVITKTKEYMVDYGEFLENEKNGGIKMIDNEELRKEIKGKIIKLMNTKVAKAKGLKLLKNEFNLPFAELSDLWLECKNMEYRKETDRVPENVGPIVVNPIINKEVVVEEKKMENINEKEAGKTVGPEKKISLKVIRVTTEVEGEYGTYIKNADGVKIGDRLYSDKDMVMKEKVKLAAEYNTKIDGVKAKIEALKTSLKEIQEIGMKEIEKFTEIESVFDI